MNKIAFFTEQGTSTGVQYPRFFENARTDVSWMIALDAISYNLDARQSENYDLGIIITPKNRPERAIELFHRQRFRCKQLAVMQEGPQYAHQDWPVPTQIEYLQMISQCDIILCHNEIDKKYYSGLIPGAKVELLQPLMIDSAITKQLHDPISRDGVMIGGNWVSWYSGHDSYSIAQDFEVQMYAPSMGRKQPYEDYFDEIKYFPYLSWRDWIVELSKMKYAVHLMRTFAAGTFSLNCAYLGIPCIAYNPLDTQRICFPELSPDEGDLVEARKCAKNLKDNELFYKHCSEYAKKAYHDNFREQIFLERFNQSIKGE